MFLGGFADKWGNRYEAKWLVRCLLKVIGGRSEWIRYEAITSDYEGFEFAIKSDGIISWHQTKHGLSNGNWTINRLNKEGVLNAFSKRLKSTETDRCIFVSGDSAKDLSNLAERSRVVNNLEEFQKTLSDKLSKPFSDLKEYWGIDPKTCWRWLQRIQTRTLPLGEIDNIIKNEVELSFESGGLDDAFSILRDYMERRFNKVVSTDSIRANIEFETGLAFKSWLHKPTLTQKFRSATESYLKSYIPFGAGGHRIHRNEPEEILHSILTPNSPSVHLVTGIAGSGKSGVARGLIKSLNTSEIPHVAFRVDHFLECNHPKDFGERLTGYRENPVITLKGYADTKTTVLIIDQMDAVSEVSGRGGAVRSAILEIIDSAVALRTVKVIIFCRSHDFKNDPRFKALEKLQNPNVTPIAALNWDTDIKPILENERIETASFSALYHFALITIHAPSVDIRWT